MTTTLIQLKEQPAQKMRRVTGSSSSSTALADDPHRKFWKDATKKIEALNIRCKKLEDEVALMCSHIAVPDTCEFAPYVISAKGEGTFHITNNYMELCADDVITKCGWPYLKWGSAHERSDVLPPEVDYKRICKRCLGRERGIRRARAPRSRHDRTPSP